MQFGFDSVMEGATLCNTVNVPRLKRHLKRVKKQSEFKDLGSKSFKVGKNIVRVSNSLDSGETPSYK